jgi:hypothetical protein
MGYRVKLYSNGVLVADETDPAAAPSHQKPQTQWLVQADQMNGSGPVEFRIICITSPCPGWTVTMNGAVYIVDQIVFQPSNAASGAPATLVDLAITGATSSGPGASALAGQSLPIYGVSGSGAPLVSAPIAAAPALAGARVSPNPATVAARIVFAMPRTGHAEVDIIDTAGRHVRSIASGTFAAGAHDLTWNGRDDRGKAAGPGVYFVRVAGAGGERTSRLTWLK